MKKPTRSLEQSLARLARVKREHAVAWANTGAALNPGIAFGAVVGGDTYWAAEAAGRTEAEKGGIENA